MSQEAIKSANRPKFDAVNRLNLPLGHWAITSSGPMGIRGLREISDVDIIVDEQLWAKLAEEYGTKHVNGLTQIDAPGDLFDINGPATFSESDDDDPAKPSMDEQIKAADIIDGLPFVALKHIIYFKQKQGRDKDLQDIEIIKKYLELEQE